jgi:DNA-directed RNA polymerase specialized sigma subunit
MGESEDLQGQGSEATLAALTLASLAHRCAEETKRWTQRLAASLRYCYELFRRAIQGRDQQAWDLVMQQYIRLMQSWAARHSQFAATGESAEHFVNGACAKLWERIPPEKFDNFPDVRSILRYLQMCIHSAITDYMRQHSAVALTVEFGEDALKEERVMVMADNTGQRAQRKEFWQAVDARLRDDKERLVIRELFVYSMKPAEILAKHPKTFRDVKEIYSIRENVVDRLARDVKLREFMT